MTLTCVDCGTPILLCSHAAKRMTDPSLAFQAQMYEGKMEDLRLLTVQALHDKDAALARAEQAEAREAVLRQAIEEALTVLEAWQPSASDPDRPSTEARITVARAALAATAASAGDGA
jgi:hypothetical protein